MITANKMYDRGGPIGDTGDFRQYEFRRSPKGFKAGFLKLKRGGALETATASVPVEEKRKVFGLSSELQIALKPLPTEESSVIGIIEASPLHSAKGSPTGMKTTLIAATNKVRKTTRRIGGAVCCPQSSAHF